MRVSEPKGKMCLWLLGGLSSVAAPGLGCASALRQAPRRMYLPAASVMHTAWTPRALNKGCAARPGCDMGSQGNTCLWGAGRDDCAGRRLDFAGGSS